MAGCAPRPLPCCCAPHSIAAAQPRRSDVRLCTAADEWGVLQGTECKYSIAGQGTGAPYTQPPPAAAREGAGEAPAGKGRPGPGRLHLPRPLAPCKLAARKVYTTPRARHCGVRQMACRAHPQHPRCSAAAALFVSTAPALPCAVAPAPCGGGLGEAWRGLRTRWICGGEFSPTALAGRRQRLTTIRKSIGSAGAGRGCSSASGAAHPTSSLPPSPPLPQRSRVPPQQSPKHHAPHTLPDSPPAVHRAPRGRGAGRRALLARPQARPHVGGAGGIGRPHALHPAAGAAPAGHHPRR